MLIKKAADILSSEITPKSLYVNRRKFLAGAALAGAGALAGELWSPSDVALAHDVVRAATVEPQSVFTGVGNLAILKDTMP